MRIYTHSDKRTMLLQMTSSFFVFLFFKFFFFIRELFISILEKERLLIEFRRTYDLQRQATSRRRRKMEIKVPFLRLLG